MNGIDPLINNMNNDSKYEKTNKIYILVIVVITIIFIIIIVSMAAVLLQSENKPWKDRFKDIFKKNTDIEQKQEKIIEKKQKPSGFPIKITSNQRLILYLQKTGTNLSNYYIFKFPIGTYNDYETLIESLNTSNSHLGIFFDSNNSIWSTNRILEWSINEKNIFHGN